jgi:ATP-dependent DNA ligase
MTLFEQIVKPMLAFLAEPFDDENFLFEVKMDGMK